MKSPIKDDNLLHQESAQKEEAEETRHQEEEEGQEGEGGKLSEALP